jgi:hypothetical protein
MSFRAFPGVSDFVSETGSVDGRLMKSLCAGFWTVIGSFGFAKKLKESRKRRNPSVQSLRREVLLLGHERAPSANVQDGSLEKLPGFLGPANREKLDEALDVASVAPLGSVVFFPEPFG